MIQTRRYQWNGGIDSDALENSVDPTAVVTTIQPNYVDVQVDDGVAGVFETLDEVMQLHGYIFGEVSPAADLTPRQLVSRIVNSTVTLNGEDEFVQISPALAAAIVLSLPLAASQPAGKIIIVKDVGGALTVVNTCQIAGQGGDTIDGAASVTLNVAFQSRMLICDGVSRWALIASIL